MDAPELQLRRWTRVEYEGLVEKGVFTPGERIELIDGLLLVSEPQTSSHFTAVRPAERTPARLRGSPPRRPCAGGGSRSHEPRL
jgi:hypothetical protein